MPDTHRVAPDEASFDVLRTLPARWPAAGIGDGCWRPTSGRAGRGRSARTICTTCWPSASGGRTGRAAFPVHLREFDGGAPGKAQDW